MLQIEVSQAGAFVRHQGIGSWWAAIPRDNAIHLNFQNIIKQNWIKFYGDRRQEIVFIGLKDEINKDIIKERLDKFLYKIIVILIILIKI